MFYPDQGNSGFFYRADSSYPADGRCTCGVELVEDELELIEAELDEEELLSPGLRVYEAASPDLLEPVGEPHGQDMRFREVKCRKPVEVRLDDTGYGGAPTHYLCKEHAGLIRMFLGMDAMSFDLPVVVTREFSGETVQAVQAEVVRFDQLIGKDGYVRTGYRWEMSARQPTISISYARPAPTG